MKYKLAVVASHPIQYQAPLFRTLAADPNLDVTVYYCWDFGISTPGFDREHGINLQWDVPLLDGYNYKLLKNYSFKPGTSFFGQINPGIVKELRENYYDAVLIHGYTTMTAWFVFLTKWYTRAKVIMRGEADLGKKNGFLKNLLKSAILKTLFKTIPAFLYSYELNKKYFIHFGVPGKKLFFFPCAVDNDFFGGKFKELHPKKAEIMKRLGINNLQATTFLFIGKLMKRKRPMDILRAAAILKDKEFNILFVGGGEDSENLQQFVSENNLKNVYFFGFKNQSEISEYYSVSDALLLPSEFDPSPKQVNEAMNFGLALVVSDGVGTAPDLILESGAGVTHKVGDVDQLASYMRQLIDSPEFLNKLKHNSMDTVPKWSCEKDALGIIEAIRSLKS